MGKTIRRVAISISVALLGVPASAQVVRQVTSELSATAGPGALDDAGTTVFSGSSSDLFGTNPQHAFQILAFDAIAGSASEVTAAADGVSILISVSDDGRYLAFPSPTDLTGENHDESIELFVLDRNTGITTQLTDDPAANAGSVSVVAISGNGARVAFVANTDPLGTNPDHLDQLFVVERDGTGLAQLTQAAAGGLGAVSISDDGSRIAFAHSGDLTGGNLDGGNEVFAILADGTNLRQLTDTPADFDSGSPSLSGNGATVAFQSNGDLTGGNAANQDEIFAIEWDGTLLRQLTTTRLVLGVTGDPAAQSPSITDDGQTVIFHSNHSTLFPFVNVDGNFEIFRVRSDGTGLTPLTSSILEVGSLLPVVSGDGNRIAYYGIDTEIALRVMDGDGNGDIELLAFVLILNQDADVAPGGTRAVFVRAEGLFSRGNIWRVQADGSDLAQVTSLSSGSPASPSIAANDTTIVFSSGADPTGGNLDGSDEIFLVNADGTGLTRLTDGPLGTASQHPVISGDASVIVFDSDADLTGANTDASREIFRMHPDGTGLVQLTDGIADTSSRLPRVDATGTWVVFESDADLDGGNPDGSWEVWRARIDGSMLERITGDPVLDSRAPDISGDGARIAFSTNGDPLGSNPEGNSEVFAYEPAGPTLRQVTSFAEGDSGGVRLAGDGNHVYFSSNAPVFESDPDEPADLYRVPFAGGPIERVGGLRAGLGGGIPIPFGGSGALATDDAGAISAFSGIGNFTGENLDGLPELWIIDRATSAEFRVGKETPTVLHWDAESGPVRYDVIRGDVAALAQLPSSDVDLGTVVCLEDDSPDNDTAGHGDDVEPLPGQVFFFLYRGSVGLDAGPGTYGASSGGGERTSSAGDCAAGP